MKLNIGFSTCPNDTFIFDALVNGKIDPGDLEFTPLLTDVEELNSMALKGELEVTKLSYHAYGHVSADYRVLDSGSALGWGNGPLMVSKKRIYPDEIINARIAIPGELTTANFLTGIAFPEAQNKKSYLFSDIEDAILDDEADIGVLIHENRFTFHERGLRLIMDLGKFWEEETSMPIPLGGIMVRRDVPEEIQQRIQELIRSSIYFSMHNPGSANEYMRKFAQEMREEIMQKHVDTFVNEFSLSLGEEGRAAISRLLELGSQKGLFSKAPGKVFV
jgi:1,4-dihydroxy-6-naphthoate synthase